MTDVIQSATNYRSQLKAELEKVDEFLRLAEEFSKKPEPEGHLELTRAAAIDTPPAAPNIARPRPSSVETATS